MQIEKGWYFHTLALWGPIDNYYRSHKGLRGLEGCLHGKGPSGISGPGLRPVLIKVKHLLGYFLWVLNYLIWTRDVQFCVGLCGRMRQLNNMLKWNRVHSIHIKRFIQPITILFRPLLDFCKVILQYKKHAGVPIGNFHSYLNHCTKLPLQFLLPMQTPSNDRFPQEGNMERKSAHLLAARRVEITARCVIVWICETPECWQHSVTLGNTG